MIPGGPGAVKVTAGCSRGSRLALALISGHSRPMSSEVTKAGHGPPGTEIAKPILTSDPKCARWTHMRPRSSAG